MDLGAPDRFVDTTQVGHGEGVLDEAGGQVRVLQLRPGALDAVGEDRGVVEGEWGSVGFVQVLEGPEAGQPCITARAGQGKVRDEGQIGHGHDMAARIPARIAVRTELFDVPDRDLDARLLLQLSAHGAVEAFGRALEAAGQGPCAPVRMAVALDQQHAQATLPDGERHRIHRHRGGRERRHVVGGQELRLGGRATGHGSPTTSMPW